jgi:hypothetical protein
MIVVIIVVVVVVVVVVAVCTRCYSCVHYRNYPYKRAVRPGYLHTNPEQLLHLPLVLSVGTQTVQSLLQSGYTTQHKVLLAWCPIPQPTNGPTLRFIMYTLEATFCCVFWALILPIYTPTTHAVRGSSASSSTSVSARTFLSTT